jgi:hypothetical protein
MDSVEEYNEQAAAVYRDASAPDWDFGSAVCVDALTALAMMVRGAHHRARTVLTPLLDIPADARLFSIRQSVARVGEAIRTSNTRHPDLTELCDRVRRFVEDEPLLP